MLFSLSATPESMSASMVVAVSTHSWSDRHVSVPLLAAEDPTSCTEVLLSNSALLALLPSAVASISLVITKRTSDLINAS